MYPDELFFGIHLYGVMIAVGILACFLTLFYMGKKKLVNPNFIDFVFYNAIIAIAVGFFFAALFQATYNYIENPERGFKFGGITFIGGLIGGILSFLVIYFILRKKLSGKLLDIIAIAPSCITVAHAFGRVGCAFAGCCYGMEVESGLAMYNHGAWRVPTQLYEAGFLFILFFVFTYLVLKKDFKYTLPLYLLLYGIFRFFIEYLRVDSRGSVGTSAISPSQLWSIVMVVSSVVVAFILKHAFNKDKSTNKANNEQT